MPIHFDASTRPIVQIRFEGAISDSDARAYVDELDTTVAQTGPKFYLCIELNGVNVEVPARDILMTWARRFEAEHVGRNLGVAFATTSRVARGMIRALHWTARPRYPWEIVSTHAQALDWCRARAASA